MNNVRVVIGAGRPNKLPALVCEYSILKHCPAAEIIHTYARPFMRKRTEHRDRWNDVGVQWIKTRPMGTMFSFCRHMVSEICEFRGEAIYVDADMLIFESMEQIMQVDMGDALIIGVEGCHQNSVGRMKCDGLAKWTIGYLLRSGLSYGDLQKNRYVPQGLFQRTIPRGWNDLHRRTSNTKLLHYTAMPNQPWVKPGNPFGKVWFDHLAEAVMEGFLTMATVEEEVREQDLSRTWCAAVYPQPHVMEELKARL